MFSGSEHGARFQSAVLLGRLHLSHALHSASTSRISQGSVPQRRGSLWPLSICVPPHESRNGTPATFSSLRKVGETGVPLNWLAVRLQTRSHPKTVANANLCHKGTLKRHTSAA